MLFLDFLRGFEGSWLRSAGFLDLVLNDPGFPDVRSWTGLDVYLIVKGANATIREEARWFWDEYQTSTVP